MAGRMSGRCLRERLQGSVRTVTDAVIENAPRPTHRIPLIPLPKPAESH